MSLLLGIIVYFTIGFLLAKGYSKLVKSSFKDMEEQDQIFIILLLFLFPFAFILILSGLIVEGLSKLLNKIL